MTDRVEAAVTEAIHKWVGKRLDSGLRWSEPLAWGAALIALDTQHAMTCCGEPRANCVWEDGHVPRREPADE